MQKKREPIGKVLQTTDLEKARAINFQKYKNSGERYQRELQTQR